MESGDICGEMGGFQYFRKGGEVDRSAPKSSAIPNFAKPGYSVKDFSDVVKHVVKSHFRPQVLKSQGRKVLEPQRFFGLAL